MHKALVTPAAGETPIIVDFDTPEPGPNEVLIQMKAFALNPVDLYQRDAGMMIQQYPGSLGHDGAGVLVKAGKDVKDAPAPGTRVLGFPSNFFKGGEKRYSAFQEYVLVEAETLVVLPDNVSFEQAAMLPLATQTAYSGWWSAGIEASTQKTPADKAAVLVLGGASSVGTLAIQTAKTMGYTVFATASKSNHEYVQSLGAAQVFDYKESDVASHIIAATKEAGLTLLEVYCATAETISTAFTVLEGTRNGQQARVATAAHFPEDMPVPDGIKIKFILPDVMSPGAREKQYAQWYGLLAKHLKSGAIVPSPRMQLEQGGLAGINAGLDKLKAGVSGTKIVVTV